MKRFLSLFLVFMLCLSLPFAVSANSETFDKNLPDKLTVESYTNWLSKNSYTGDSNEQILDEFNNLTSSEKEKFVGYLNNEHLMGKVMKALINGDEANFKSGDIVISSKSDFDIPLYSTQAKTAQVSHTRAITFLGIEVIRLRNHVRYQHNGSRVTNVISGGLTVVKNYGPLFSFSSKNNTGYTSSEAYNIADITVKFGYGNIGLTTGAAEFGVAGNAKEQVRYWVTKY